MKKEITSKTKYLASLFILFILFFGFYRDVLADYQNLISDSSVQTGSSYNHFVQTLGTGLSGSLSQVDIQTSNPAFIYYGSTPYLVIFECDDSSYGGLLQNERSCSVLYEGLAQSSSLYSTSTQSFLTGGISLDPTKYYYFLSQGNNQFNTLTYYYGSLSDTIEGSCYKYISGGNFYGYIDCPDVADLYFNLVGVDKVETPEGNSSVLFIPGIMASRLYKEKGSIDCGDVLISNDCFEHNEVWASVFDSDHVELALNTQGKSINPIYTIDDVRNNGESRETGIIDEIFGFNLYKSFISDLRKWKSEEIISDYAFIPYDWRLSLEDIITNGATTTRNKLEYTNSQNFSESYILKKLLELQQSSHNGKVTIIAHSNGGLVAKALVQKLKDTNNPLYNQIDKIILVAVPQVGTPDAISALLHGSSIGFGLLMTNQRSRALMENMPSVYNLLPSSGYFTTIDPAFEVGKVILFKNDPLFSSQLSEYGVFVSNEEELKDYILGTDGRIKPEYNDTKKPNIGNSVLYSKAQSVHSMLDTWQPSSTTEIIQIAGWGEETLAGLDYVVNKNYLSPDTISYKPRKVIDGDGTVVVPSALWMSTSTPNVERWWVNLLKYNNPILGNNRIHRDILEIPNLRNFIKSLITGKTFIDPENIVVSNTSILISGDTRLHYTLHSPLTLGVVDSLGRYTGLDPITLEIKEEIPGVAYEQIGEVQFISIPKNFEHTLRLQGLSEGSFSLDIEKQIGNNVVDSASFQGIPTSTSTAVTLVVGQDLEINDYVLSIDNNGDGQTDKYLNAVSEGVVVYDTTPPELQITFDLNTKDVVFSSVDSIDKNSSIDFTDTEITLTDLSGNTTIIPFKKFKDSKTKLRLVYNKIIRNGIETSLPNTNIIYDWKEKKGELTDLDTRIIQRGVERYIFNYNKTKNATIIKERKNSNIIKNTKSGFVVVNIETQGDGLEVNY